MKHFKFWVKESFEINVKGTAQTINILSGSNVSLDDAVAEGQKRSLLIEQRIASGEPKEEYDVAIKEHIEQRLDDDNVVSICRYGAKVLNTTQYTILDLDDYPLDFLDIFRSLGGMSKKERIVYKFLSRIKKFPELGSDFRIYETTKGIRVIGKTYLDPTSRRAESIMRKLAVDWIYIHLSRRQQCYRARLTPKPYRMKIPTIRVKTPMVCETQEYHEWSNIYEKASQQYSVVKLMKTLGNDFSTDPAIKLHDTVCNTYKELTLA